MTHAERFLAVFTPAPHAHYKARPGASKPGAKVEFKYTAVPGAIDVQAMGRHLAGQLPSLLAIPIDSDACARFGVIDIDVYPLDLKALAVKVAQLHLPLVVTKSKSGGAHLWWFLREPRAAVEVQQQLKAWAVLLGFPGAEVFPKQIALTDEDKGNGINLPYFGGERRAVDIAGDELPLDRFLDMAGQMRTREVEPTAPVVVEPVAPASAGPRKYREPERHNQVKRIAGVYHFKNGMTGKELEGALLGWNAEHCEPPLPIEEVVDLARNIASKAVKGEAAETYRPIPPRAPLDWLALAGREPPERDWVLSYWIPAGHITLLSGRGGIGKTLIAQHLATSMVTGHEYLAMVPRPRRVLFWAGEDDHDELWRRQLRINHYFGIEPAQLHEQLILHSYAGADITLMAPVYGQLVATPMLEELRAQVADYRADFVFLDNVARLFGGNENDRHAVTTFLALTQGACAPAGIGLLGHPAKSLTSEYSGNTAWEGSVRARLYMSDTKPGTKGDDNDDDVMDERVRYLSRRKANYSALDCRRFEFDNGVLVPEQVDFVGPEDALTKRDMQATVRLAVERLAEMQQHGTTSTSSPMYLPKLAKDYRLMGRLNRQQFMRTMRQMLLDKTLVVDVVGKYAKGSPRNGIRLP